MARPRKPPRAVSCSSRAAGSRRCGNKRSFHQELVLNRCVLGFFQGGTLAALKMRLGDDRFEGIDEDGQTKFFHELVRGLFDPNKVPEADLRRYDLNVVAHRSEEHTSELQSLMRISYAVFCLKKKTKYRHKITRTNNT